MITAAIECPQRNLGPYYSIKRLCRPFGNTVDYIVTPSISALCVMIH